MVKHERPAFLNRSEDVETMEVVFDVVKGKFLGVRKCDDGSFKFFWPKHKPKRKRKNKKFYDVPDGAEVVYFKENGEAVFCLKQDIR
jgi:hypothetical protein